MSESPAPPGIRRNVYSALAAQWVSAAMAIVSSVLVARMMQPEELGIFTVTTAIMAVLTTLQFSGTGEFLLYTRDVDLRTRRSVFGLTILSTGAVCLALVLGRPWIAAFYGNPAIADVLLLAALNSVMGTMAAPVMTMFAREQRFDLTSIINVTCNAVMSIGQVVLVWLGYSYMGLVYAMLMSSAVSIVMHFSLGRRHVLFIPSFRGLRPIVGFGSKLFATNLVSQINFNSPQIVIGHLSGLATAALYGRANMITQIYSQTVARAIDPVINARIAADGRNGQDSYTSLLFSSRATLAVAIPFFGFVALAAPLIVPLVFGPQWISAVPAMSILAVGLIPWPLSAPTAALVLAASRPGYLLRLRTANAIVRIALVVALTPFGLAAVAAGVAASSLFGLCQSLIAARNIAGISLRRYVWDLRSSALAASVPVVLAGGSLFALDRLAVDPWLQLIGSGLVLLVGWVVMLAITRHLLWNEMIFLLARFKRSA